MGYEVDQSVMVKIRDLSKTSNVIGALGKAGFQILADQILK